MNANYNFTEMENGQVKESKLAMAVRCTLCLTIFPLIYIVGKALTQLL
jgi:hypothetical protein